MTTTWASGRSHKKLAKEKEVDVDGKNERNNKTKMKKEMETGERQEKRLMDDRGE